MPAACTSKNTSKKLLAVPVPVKGGTSRVPGVLLEVSSISPVVRRCGCLVGSRSVTVIGP